MHICTTYEQDKRELNANAALTGDLKVVPIEGKAHAAYTLTRKVPKMCLAEDHCYTTLGAIHQLPAQPESIFQRQLTCSNVPISPASWHQSCETMCMLHRFTMPALIS